MKPFSSKYCPYTSPTAPILTLNLAVPSPDSNIVAAGDVVKPTPGFKSSIEPIEPASLEASFGIIDTLFPANPVKLQSRMSPIQELATSQDNESENGESGYVESGYGESGYVESGYVESQDVDFFSIANITDVTSGQT